MEPSLRKLAFVVITHYMQVMFVNDETRDTYETCRRTPDPLQAVHFATVNRQQSYEKILQKITVNVRKLSQKMYCSAGVLEYISLNPLKIAWKEFFLNCYLAVPRPTLGHYRRGSLTHPMLITAF